MIDFTLLQDIRQTKEYACFMEKMGWQVEKIEQTYIYIKKLPLLPFSIIKILRSSWPIQLGKVKKMVKKYRPLFIKIQPFRIRRPKTEDRRQMIEDGKWKMDRSPLIPTKTIWINLKKSEEQLLKEMRRKTRRASKSAHQYKLKIIEGNKISDQELQTFYHLWKKNKPFNFLFKPNFN
jgi:lipid II:glycine glycyltransferase (peptidoglycan interpeptide bridge formation enzyme)